MDKTKEYILQSKKAKEIQFGHNWGWGDWLIAEHGVFQIGTATFNYDIKDIYRPPIRSELPVATVQNEDIEAQTFTGELIWLPTQNQLQEMLYKHWWGDKQPSNKVSSVVQKLVWCMDDNITKYCIDSMEQLWLAFVMKELYNKVWQEGEWK